MLKHQRESRGDKGLEQSHNTERFKLFLVRKKRLKEAEVAGAAVFKCLKSCHKKGEKNIFPCLTEQDKRQ